MPSLAGLLFFSWSLLYWACVWPQDFQPDASKFTCDLLSFCLQFPWPKCHGRVLILILFFFTWLRRWFPHRLLKRQSLTTVLLRTPITQMIFFNQGMLLLGSNHFLLIIIIIIFILFILSFCFKIMFMQSGFRVFYMEKWKKNKLFKYPKQ